LAYQSFSKGALDVISCSHVHGKAPLETNSFIFARQGRGKQLNVEGFVLQPDP